MKGLYGSGSLKKFLLSLLFFSLFFSPVSVILRQYFKIYYFERWSILIFFVFIVTSLLFIFFRARCSLLTAIIAAIILSVFSITTMANIEVEIYSFIYALYLLMIVFVIFFYGRLYFEVLEDFISFCISYRYLILFYYFLLVLFYRLDVLGVAPYSSFDLDIFSYFALIFLVLQRYVFFTFCVFVLFIASKWSLFLSVSFVVAFYCLRLKMFLFVFLSMICMFFLYSFDEFFFWLSQNSSSMAERVAEVLLVFKDFSLLDYLFGKGFTMHYSGQIYGYEFEERRFVHNSFAFLLYAGGILLLTLYTVLAISCVVNIRGQFLSTLLLFACISSFFKLSLVTELMPLLLISAYVAPKLNMSICKSSVD